MICVPNKLLTCMKQSHGPVVWDFACICNETRPYRSSWGTFPLPWL